jgi:glucokinase
VPGLTALAIDLGGSHAACGVVREGAILAARTIAADGSGSLAELLPQLAATFRELVVEAGVDKSECSALVLGFCGIASARENRVLGTNGKFVDAANLDLAAWSRDALGLPFFIENDARLALLGEHAFGAARGAQDAVMVTLGSGVGGSALLNGRLLESKHGLAGTICGHFPVVLGGRRCSCGNVGCAEAEASTAFLPEIYQEQTRGDVGVLAGRRAFGFAEVFAAADAGDKSAVATLSHCCHVWSALTVAMIHAYDPEVVVFGGSVLKRAPDILPRLQQHVTAHAWTPGRTIDLRAAELGSNAALLGAIPLIKASH